MPLVGPPSPFRNCSFTFLDFGNNLFKTTCANIITTATINTDIIIIIITSSSCHLVPAGSYLGPAWTFLLALGCGCCALGSRASVVSGSWSLVTPGPPLSSSIHQVLRWKPAANKKPEPLTFPSCLTFHHKKTNSIATPPPHPSRPHHPPPAHTSSASHAGLGANLNLQSPLESWNFIRKLCYVSIATSSWSLMETYMVIWCPI